MSGRTYVVILFFWALLTIITPMLVRLSASANLYSRLDGMGFFIYQYSSTLILYISVVLHFQFQFSSVYICLISCTWDFSGQRSEGVKLLLPRRALVAATVSPAPAPAPAPAPVSSVKGGVSGREDAFSDEFRSHFDRNWAGKIFIRESCKAVLLRRNGRENLCFNLLLGFQVSKCS